MKKISLWQHKKFKTIIIVITFKNSYNCKYAIIIGNSIMHNLNNIRIVESYYEQL